MKTKLLISMLAIISWSTKAQTLNGNYLDVNNVKAPVAADGGLFQYGNNGTEVPTGSGKTTLFSSALWIGGYDAGNILHIAAQTYRQNGNDFFPGPIDTTGTYGTAYNTTWNRVWKIRQCDIDAHYNWFTGGSVGPDPMLNDSVSYEAMVHWPVYDLSGQALAPFYDFNGDGLYDFTTGDVPQIKGDEAIFFVYNDARSAHGESGGAALGVEIQGMAYEYSCSHDSALFNTVFTSYKIINKSHTTIDSTFVGNWTDLDIGYYNDDFIGCDVNRGAYYGYNGVAVDATYGANPPAEGVLFLDGPFKDPNGFDDAANSVPADFHNYGDGIVDNERLGMTGFTYINNTNNAINGNPGALQGGSTDDYYQYMTGSWKNGQHWKYGSDGTLGGTNCNYIYPATSDPSGFGTNMIPQAGWDEVTLNHTPGDRRGIGSTGPFTLHPNQSQILDFAYIYGRATQGGPLASIATVKTRIDSIRYKFNAGLIGRGWLPGQPSWTTNLCGCNTSTGIANIQHPTSEITIFPNPATDNLTISYTSTSKSYTINIYNAIGSLVKTVAVKNNNTTIDIGDLHSGIYLLNIADGNNVSVKRFVKE